MRRNFLMLAAVCGLAVPFARCNTANFTNFVFEPLAFPVGNVADIVRIAAFGIPNWSGAEPHNGTDLIIDDSLASTRIISPTAGVVTSISTSENPFSDPPGQLLLTVSIRINGEWTVHLVLEPSTVDSALRTAQLAAILVSEGETVEIGTPVADLMVGTLGYPHLHYMVEHGGEAVCAYAHSSEDARAAFESLAALPDSHLPDGNICYGQP